MITRSAQLRLNAKSLRHPDADSTFRLGLSSLFRQWTALSLAVTHEWGGASSREKADLLIDEIMDLFESPDKVYKDDVALILEDCLETDFNTICEDESPDEIGEILVTMWRQCSVGDFSLVNSVIAKEGVIKDNLRQSKGLDGGDEMDSDDENEGKTLEEVVDVSDLSKVNGMEEESTTNTSDIIPTTKTIDPDGWEVVTNKRSSRRK